MKKTIILIVAVLLQSMHLSAADSSYRNPVIAGFHPDPSVCRVGDDFYLVNSSFQYFPGVPLFHSRDMIHWEQIGNVLDRESQLPLANASSWTGIYAPTIRYNDGTFYMITTNIGNGGNFLVTAQNPKGPWSDPVWLKQQGIDPSLYFEDGKCYMVSNPGDAIWLCEIDPKTGAQLTESRQLWQGTGGRYPEGPHVYKKDGMYYLLISEGGTEYGHSITIARSKSIYGPYEANPRNPILCHQRRITEGSQIQGTGHGDLVQARDGSWWLAFLAFRTYGGNYHHLGRETFVAPVEWEQGGWPVVNVNGTVDTLMNVRTLPQTDVPHKAASVDFSTMKDMKDIGPEWIYIQNPDMAKYGISGGRLRLTPSMGSLTENKKPTFIGRRQQNARFSMTTAVEIHDLQDGGEAGLTAYQINDGHYDVCLSMENGKQVIKCKYQVKGLVTEKSLADVSVSQAKKVYLRIRGDENMYYFDYSLDGKAYQTLSSVNACLLSSEVAGGFTGVILGMYSTSSDKGFATFDFADYMGR
jgi:xylan 1,4-beta-xylosidase